MSGAVLNLTGRNSQKTELSDILYETAIVHKQYIPKEDNLALGIALRNPALGLVMSESEKYNVTLEGKLSFTLNDKSLFESLEENGQVKVGFRESYLTTIDKKGNPIKKSLSGYKIVSIEKLN